MPHLFVRRPLVALVALLSSAVVACSAEEAGTVDPAAVGAPAAETPVAAAPVTATDDVVATESTSAGAPVLVESAPLPENASGVEGGAAADPGEGRAGDATATDEGLPEEPAPEVPAAAPAVAAKTLATYRGVNLSGAEFGSTVPGKFGLDYTFPSSAEVDYYMGKGANTFRIPSRWERLQTSAYATLDATYLGKLDALVVYATKKGAKVVLNPQNFARYYNKVVGTTDVPNAAFADFWKKIATKYKGNPNVLFNLMNEPHDLPSEQWVGAANAAIVGIRTTGATNTIIVPGNAWTGAHSWNEKYYGTPNAVAMLKIADSKNNVLFEVHQYLDADSSGKSDQCVSKTIGSERLKGFVKWLRDNGKKGFLGELAGGRNANCYAAVSDMLKYVGESSDVMSGWLWWGAGPWWGETYPFSLDAIAGKDRPQMSVLAPFLR